MDVWLVSDVAGCVVVWLVPDVAGCVDIWLVSDVAWLRGRLVSFQRGPAVWTD